LELEVADAMVSVSLRRKHHFRKIHPAQIHQKSLPVLQHPVEWVHPFEVVPDFVAFEQAKSEFAGCTQQDGVNFINVANADDLNTDWAQQNLLSELRLCI
jgi:hypothetical protein